MKKILLLLFIIFCSSNIIATENIIASVDNQAITRSDLKGRADMIFTVNHVPKHMQVSLLPQIVDMLIDEKLYHKAAKQLKIKLDEDELKQYIEMIEKQNNIPKGEFTDSMKHMGVDGKEAVKQMEGQLLWQKITHYKFSDYVNVSSQDLDFYKLVKPEFGELSKDDLSEGIVTYRTGKIAANYLAKMRRESVIVKYTINDINK